MSRSARRIGPVVLFVASLWSATAAGQEESRLELAPLMIPSQVRVGTIRPLVFCLVNQGDDNQLLAADADHALLRLPSGDGSADLVPAGATIACSSPVAEWECQVQARPDATDVVMRPSGSFVRVAARSTICFELTQVPINATPGLARATFRAYVSGGRANERPPSLVDILKARTGVILHSDLVAVEPDQHHVKTSRFSELSGAASDAQVPDDITIRFAARAGDADKVDGRDGNSLAGKDEVEELRRQLGALTQRVADLEQLLEPLSRSGNDLVLSGANLRVVNGAGRTATHNGTGNVIVGYNEPRAGTSGGTRAGSHMLVVGSGHEYSSYGGIVAGFSNTSSAPWAGVTGGSHNIASAEGATVSAGSKNLARGEGATISGGRGNTAWGSYAAVSGGLDNQAGGEGAAVSGGRKGLAAALGSTVCGGESNLAGAIGATASGGSGNEATGERALVAGGQHNTASAPLGVVSGGQKNTAAGPELSWVGGGMSNTAASLGGSVCGGRGNVADGKYATVAGECDQFASGTCEQSP